MRQRPSGRLIGLATTLALALAVPASPTAAAPEAAYDGSARPAAATPALAVRPIVRGLDLPWDVKALPSGRLLITERESRRLLTWHRGTLRRVAFPSASVWAQGETGLMSLAVDPRFGKNRRFYTCQGSRVGGSPHVRVVAWRLNRKATRARLARVLLSSLPATSGRHGGCRLLIARSGSLIVGTGDAAVGSNPRNLGSFGGKTLQLDRMTGAPWRSNPFIGSSNRVTRYLLTFGHRNVQGLAQRADGSLWSVEHGPDRDDEVNRLRAGGDYGWHPVPGYDESVPMTDQALPGTQIDAAWSSGVPTVAASGAAWVNGSRWGSYDGTLAVATLKGSRLMFFRLDSAGRFQSVVSPAALGVHGRLRSVTQLSGGDLLVTTSNGDRRDVILRVTPRP